MFQICREVTPGSFLTSHQRFTPWVKAAITLTIQLNLVAKLGMWISAVTFPYFYRPRYLMNCSTRNFNSLHAACLGAPYLRVYVKYPPSWASDEIYNTDVIAELSTEKSLFFYLQSPKIQLRLSKLSGLGRNCNRTILKILVNSLLLKFSPGYLYDYVHLQ